MIVDVHNHVLPAGAREWLGPHGEDVGVSLEQDLVVHREGFCWPVTDRFTDADLIAEDLASRGIDAALISVPPPLLLHQAPMDAAAEFIGEVNRGLLEMAEAHPARFRVLGSVLLQDPEAAAAEVDRLERHERCVGVQIGVSLQGPAVEAPSFGDFWHTLARSRLMAMLHPVYLGPIPGLQDRYLTNIVGNPLLTTAAAMRMIDGGLFNQDPAPRVLLAHAGGFLPYQLGRLAHASEVRPELRCNTDEVKSAALCFLYDSITHSPEALRFLISLVGVDRVLLGSDAPFDMADPDPLGTVRAASCDAFEQVTTTNVARVLGDRGFDQAAVTLQ